MYLLALPLHLPVSGAAFLDRNGFPSGTPLP
jgi:hypothetical protein